MKRCAAVMALVLMIGIGCVHAQKGDKGRKHDACETIPRSALERAEQALQEAHPAWGVIPVIGDNGEWRCRTGGAYVRRYDKTADGRRALADMTLYVDKDGTISLSDMHGCFSLDRWK